MNATNRARERDAERARDIRLGRWTAGLVEDRLIEAQRVISATVHSPVPRERARDIPPGVNYFGEDQIIEFERLRYAYFKQEGYFDDAGNQLKPLPWRWPLETAQPQAAIDRATEAMSWPVLHVRDGGRRLAVLCWVLHRAHRGGRHGFTELLNQRRRLMFLSAVERWQAHRDRRYGMDQIARHLNDAGTPLNAVARAA